MQKFTSKEHAKFKAADPDDVVCVRVGQIAVLIEQNEQLLAKNEQLLAKDARSKKRKQNIGLKMPSLSSAFRTLTAVVN